MKKFILFASLAVMTVNVWGMENYITPDSSPSKNSDMINISDTPVPQNSVANENVEFQSFQQSLRTIQYMQKIIINQIELLSLFPQKPEYFNYLLSLNSFMYGLCLPKNNTEAEETLSYMRLVFRDLNNHYDEDFKKLGIPQIPENTPEAECLPDQKAYLNEQLGLEENNLNFNESNNLTNEHSTTLNDVFLSVLNDLPIGPSMNESGWAFNGFHSNVGGSQDISQLANDNSTEIIPQNIDRKGKRKAEESEDVQDNISAKKVRRVNQIFRAPNAAIYSQNPEIQQLFGIHESSLEEVSQREKIEDFDISKISKAPWYDSFEMPSNPELEERFFEAAATDDEIKIDKDTAKKIIKDWRIVERHIWRSFWKSSKDENGNQLNEDDLKKLQKFYKKDSFNCINFCSESLNNLRISTHAKKLLNKIREGINSICKNVHDEHPSYNEKQVKKLIYYRDYLMLSKDNSGVPYKTFRCCNNSPLLAIAVNKWQRQYLYPVALNVFKSIEDAYRGDTHLYLIYAEKRGELFPKVVNHLREIGLTDKKISYIINFNSSNNDTKDKEARQFFSSEYKIALKRYGYLEAQKKTISLLKKQDHSNLFINRFLGNSSINVENYRKLKNIQQENKQSIESQITEIIDTYENEKRTNLTAAIQKAVNKLSKDIGFRDWRIMELLELSDDKIYPSQSQKKMLRGFYDEDEEIKKDPDEDEKLRKSIEDARRKNAVLMYKELGQKVWQIADFFGVTRDEIRGYLRDAENMLPQEP